MSDKSSRPEDGRQPTVPVSDRPLILELMPMDILKAQNATLTPVDSTPQAAITPVDATPTHPPQTSQRRGTHELATALNGSASLAAFGAHIGFEVERLGRPAAHASLSQYARTAEAAAGHLKGVLAPHVASVRAEMWNVAATHPTRLPADISRWHGLEEIGALTPNASKVLGRYSGVTSVTEQLRPLIREDATRVANLSWELAQRQGFVPMSFSGEALPRSIGRLPEVSSAVQRLEKATATFNAETVAFLKAERIKTAGALAGAFAVNTALDYTVFSGKKSAEATYISDTILPFAILATNKIPMSAKLAIMIGGHAIARSIEDDR